MKYLHYFLKCVCMCVCMCLCFPTQLCFEVHAVGFVPITSSCQLVFHSIVKKKQKQSKLGYLLKMVRET